MALVVGTNTWVTEEGADSYFASRAGAGDWSSADKDALLTTAFYDLIDCGEFGLVASSSPTDAIQRAQCEQALFRLLDPDVDLRVNTRAQGVIKGKTTGEDYAEWVSVIPVAPKARGILRTAGNISNKGRAGVAVVGTVERIRDEDG